MNWHDMALAAAGGIGCFTAAVHGVLLQRLLVTPILKVQSTDGSMPRARQRLIAPLLHLSTFAWLVGGLSLIIVAIWLGRDAKLALGSFVASLYLYGSVFNFRATRGRHYGWMLMAVAVGLIAVGLSI